ncbi:hypothetical protein Sjap_000097 [Stephania japonica]|uniref:Uncharacterized protein n=1 Tax=Stephania japonica TaxID=461633 RepID=A0AAP0PQE6_9MAGN
MNSAHSGAKSSLVRDPYDLTIHWYLMHHGSKDVVVAELISNQNDHQHWDLNTRSRVTVDATTQLTSVIAGVSATQVPSEIDLDDKAAAYRLAVENLEKTIQLTCADGGPALTLHSTTRTVESRKRHHPHFASPEKLEADTTSLGAGFLCNCALLATLSEDRVENVELECVMVCNLERKRYSKQSNRFALRSSSSSSFSSPSSSNKSRNRSSPPPFPLSPKLCADDSLGNWKKKEEEEPLLLVLC